MTPADFDPATIAATALRLDTAEKREANEALYGAACIGARAMLARVAEALRPTGDDVATWTAEDWRSQFAAYILGKHFDALAPILAASPEPGALAYAAFADRCQAAGVGPLAIVDADARRSTAAPSDCCATRVHAWDALTWQEKKAVRVIWHGRSESSELPSMIDCDGCGAKAGKRCGDG